MSKIKATDNTATNVETKTDTTITVVEPPATESTEYTEAKKTNAAFDEKLKFEPEKPAAEEVSGDDKTKVGDDDAADKKAEAKAEAKPADDEIPAETTAQEEEEIKSLINRAAEVGLTKEQVESFSSKEDLGNAVGILESRHKEKKTEEPAKIEKKTEEVDKPYDCGLDPELYDAGLIAAVNKIGDDFHSQIKALKEGNAGLKTTVDTFSERDRQQAVNEHTSWFDDQLAGLEGFEDVFGKGTIKDIDQNSEEFKNRAALDEEMYTIAAGYKATNRKVPTKADLFQMALNIKFPEKVKGVVIAGAGKKLDRRASQALGRGSGKGSPATEIDKANEANKDFDKKLAG